MAEGMMVFIENGQDRARRCTVLGKRLNRYAKKMYNMTEANVAVFARSDQARVYQYASTVEGGLDAVMDRLGFTPTMEFDLLGKLRRDRDALQLGERSMAELASLEAQLLVAMQGIQAAEANLG